MREEEKNEVCTEPGGDSAAEGTAKTFRERAANFFYYYKWHALVALVLVVAITVCAVQCGKKEDYDLYLLYAGSGEIKTTSQNGDLSPYAKVVSSAKLYATDTDGNGKLSIVLNPLFVLSDEEIRKAEEDLSGYEINYAVIADNIAVLKDALLYSEYYVCFLSPGIFEDYASVSGVSVFRPVADFLSREGPELCGECGVYLRSTRLAAAPGFSDLPEDTVICLRTKPVISSAFTKSKNERYYAAAEDFFRAVLNAE